MTHILKIMNTKTIDSATSQKVTKPPTEYDDMLQGNKDVHSREKVTNEKHSPLKMKDQKGLRNFKKWL